MIVYDARKLGGYDIFMHWMGSSLFNRHSFPHAVLSGLFSMLFAYEKDMVFWFKDGHFTQATAYFGGISFIVGFVVVYRSQISYTRYSQAQEAYFDMASKLHDFISFMNAFLTGDDEETQILRNTLIRWTRAYHSLAIEEFQGIEFGSTFERVNLSQEEIDLLARDRKRQIQISSWMHRLIMENRSKFVVGDAILSRAFQISTQANLYFNNARRISETPFPFPFVQLTGMMIHMWSILTPIVVGAFFPESFGFSFFVTFASTWILFAVNETAAQLEMPFEETSNNLPLVYYSISFEDDMSAIKYMELPKVFNDLKQVRDDKPGDRNGRDENTLDDHKQNIHGQTSQHEDPNRVPQEEDGSGESTYVEEIDEALHRRIVEKRKFDDRPDVLKRFRLKSKLSAIEEPVGARSNDDLSPHLGQNQHAETTPAGGKKYDSPTLRPRATSGSALFDLFSLNRDDIIKEKQNEESGSVVDDTQSNLSKDDSEIASRHRSIDEPLSVSQERMVDHMDSNAVLYHTVHGSNAKKMASQLMLEREVLRRAAANRAVVLKMSIDRQRHDMRHHLFHVNTSEQQFSMDQSIGTFSSLPVDHHDHNQHLDGVRRSSSLWSRGRRRSKSKQRSRSLDHVPGGDEPPTPEDSETTQEQRPQSTATRRRSSVSTRNASTHRTIDIATYSGYTTCSLAHERARGVFEVFN
mmetsp:Transcript_19963/g.32905  ORF Transcript_19963/g.32905 Transcript_19963/m.32905 type:complete len:694 (+) Transcript_19963:285-2366(+)